MSPGEDLLVLTAKRAYDLYGELGYWHGMRSMVGLRRSGKPSARPRRAGVPDLVEKRAEVPFQVPAPRHSPVMNYRSQFTKIIAESSFQELLRRLRERRLKEEKTKTENIWFRECQLTITGNPTLRELSQPDPSRQFIHFFVDRFGLAGSKMSSRPLPLSPINR